jgi:HD-GYP domain-containing protein (c-di-GMP phosphodiesterase class II)
LFDQIKATLSEEDQKLFLSHPKDASHLIKRYFSSAPPDTDTLVFQHHELPDGSGFPLGIKAEKISPLAALFIIANEFAYYFLTDQEPSMDEFLLRCNGRFDFVNFRKVVKALEKIRLKR